MEDDEPLDPHPTDGVAIEIIIAIFFHRTADAPRNLGPCDRAIVTIQSSEVRSDGVEGLWKNSTIAVRSSRDRGAIEPRSRLDKAGIGELTWWNRCHSSGRRSTNDHDHDHGSITVR